METKTITVLNISLILISVLLLLNFFEIKQFNLGNAFYSLDRSEPVCVTELNGNFTDILTDYCCEYLSLQLVKNQKVDKIINNITVTRHYYTSDSTVGFWINDKAYRLCKEGGFFV